MAVWFPPSATVPQLVYSQYLNEWVPPPSLSNGIDSYHQTAASVVLVEPNGVMAKCPSKYEAKPGTPTS